MIKQILFSFLSERFKGAFLIAMVFSAISVSAWGSIDKEASLVEIEISKTRYDFSIPWVTRSAQTSKNGIVIDGKRILTTADGLSGQYLCRVRKGGIARQYTATLKWVDYYSNLAVFEVEDADFWDGMKAMQLAEEIPLEGNLQIIRWRNGRIEQRAAEIERLYVGSGKLSYAYHLNLSVSSEIDAAGWAEVVVNEQAVVGLTSSASSNSLTILPSTFIQSVLKRKADGDDSGLGHFDFRVMHGKNPALLLSKGLDSTDAGVVVIEVGSRGISNGVLKKGDVILEIDGFEVDTEAKYVDPKYGRLSMYGLATRDHSADEILPMKIWRDGSLLELDYVLPRADFNEDIIPEENYDKAPEYLIAGGLVFQPLTGPFLNIFRKHTPIILDYYSETDPVKDREGLVLISAILPDPFNRGYEDARLLIVDSINEKSIESIGDVETALNDFEGNFHQIEFFDDQSLRHLILDANELDTATTQILERYNIPARRSSGS